MLACRMCLILIKLFTFLFVDMEHHEVAKYTLRRNRRVYRLLKGVKISISTDRNVDNELIPVIVKK